MRFYCNNLLLTGAAADRLWGLGDSVKSHAMIHGR